MKKLYYIIYIGILMMLLAGCQDEGMFTPETEGDEPVYVTYRVHMGDETLSRAIGDAKKVNELKVGVFQNDQLLKVFTFDKAENAEAFTNVTLPLLKQETYDLVFWAQKKDNDNGIYSIDENFNITIDYAKYQGISLAGTEDFEAFTVVKKNVSVAEPGGATITLTRPFAQLNIAASEKDIFNKVNKVSFTIDKVYKKFNPLTGVFTDEVAENQEFLYSFSDQGIAAKDSITIEGANYYYLASAYLLAPETVSLRGGLYKDTETVKELNFTDLPLNPNTRTNIYGDMIQQEELQGWDGITFTEPTLEGVSCNVTADLHIDTPEELAWVLKNGYPANSKTIHICSNLNMGGKTIEEMKSVPEGITIIGDAPQGTLSYSISNLQVPSSGLFGDATNITIKNIRFDKIEVSNSAAHTGVLVGTLKGSSVFENVTIENSSVNSSNLDSVVVGGMVGYISRINETSRDEEMSVSFNGCQMKNTSVEGTVVGKFVGMLSGYDNKETLSFTNCSTEEMVDMDTSFENADKSCFSEDLAEDDFLGHEKYHRGVVNFGENRFVPKWDGTTKIEPLKDDDTILIYSAFDVAYLQKSSHSAVTFNTNVDLGGKKFDPIKSITNLDGQNNTIYNLKVDMVHDGIGAAFIQSASGTTSHKDLKFIKADIHNDHNKSIPIPEYGNEEDGGAGNAYAGTLVATVGGTYSVTNIHAEKGKVSAICKMGGLIGRVSGIMTMDYCSVKEYTLENYEANIPNYYNVPPYDIADLGIVHGLQWWYTQGECGGLIGFIQSPNTIIKKCSVTDTNINCYGQPNKSVVANVWLKTRFEKNPLYTSGQNLLAKANTDIAGRHVNQFIGDVVSQRLEEGTNYVVTIEDYEVSGNRYFGKDASNNNDYNHNYEKNKYCEVVGCAYYVGVDVDALNIKRHIMFCAGELTFNAKGGEKTTITENVGNGNSIAWKGGSFTDLQTTMVFWSPKSEYPAPPPTQ